MATKPAGKATAPTSLSELVRAESSCRRCPLYEFATQAVPGEGAIGAWLMLVGEQPGDREDLKGRPFVGPAGRVLDEGLEAAGIVRDETFVTNAVKHFKHEERGKRRLHKRPNAYEVERCRWWLDNERRLVKPRAIVALGVTAAQSLLGKSVTISRLRGQPQRLADGVPAVVTIHPSLLLRLRDEAEKRDEFARLVADLRQAREASR